MTETQTAQATDRPGAKGAALHTHFRADVLAGLAQPQKVAPARWLYDTRGSELFEAITDLPEYYPTRTEREILSRRGPEIGAAVGSGAAVVEFGAGSAAKTPLLLDCVDPAAYVAIDIAGEFLRDSADRLAARYPQLPIFPVVADFMRPVALPDAVRGLPHLGFFPGSTIGNMGPGDAIDLLRAMRSTLGADARLVIGLDLVKDRDVLIAAYDDAAGVTAAFNLNLLERINRELDGDIPVADFRHRAVWNDAHARIEMHLEAQRDLAFTVAGARFTMRSGETIHTENSHKYDRRSAAMLLLAGEWEPAAHFMDAEQRFMVVVAHAASDHLTP